MFQRILLAVDRSEAGQLALSLSIAVAARHPAAVRVIHVNSYQSPGKTPETDEQAFAIVDRAVMGLLEAGIEATGVAAVATCFGVADRLAAEAEDWGADVIVMGSSRKRTVRRLLGRDVRHRVTGLSNLPVLVAPAPLQLRRRGRMPSLDRVGRLVAPAR